MFIWMSKARLREFVLQEAREDSAEERDRLRTCRSGVRFLESKVSRLESKAFVLDNTREYKVESLLALAAQEGWTSEVVQSHTKWTKDGSKKK